MSIPAMSFLYLQHPETSLCMRLTEVGGGCRGAADTVCSMWRLLSLMHFIKKGIIQRAFLFILLQSLVLLTIKLLWIWFCFWCHLSVAWRHFTTGKRNLRTSVSSELLRWPRLRETETSLLLWRRMTRDEKSWLMNGIEQKWRHDCTAASHVSRPGAVLDPGKSIWPKKASGRLFFFYSRGTLLRITSSQKMRGKLYYALS